jgi:hypothetical protein
LLYASRHSWSNGPYHRHGGETKVWRQFTRQADAPPGKAYGTEKYSVLNSHRPFRTGLASSATTTGARMRQNRNYAISLQDISEALVACGYTSLDGQAKALGIHRSTAWTIIKTKHKLGRLSTKTTKRILANPVTPPAVRSIVQKYMAERSDLLASRAERLNRREQQSNKLRAVGN